MSPPRPAHGAPLHHEDELPDAGAPRCGGVLHQRGHGTQRRPPLHRIQGKKNSWGNFFLMIFFSCLLFTLA